MAGLVRVGIGRLFNGTGSRTLLFTNKDGKLVRAISSVSTRSVEGRPEKPKPWNYHEKSFTIFNYFFDKTSARMDENSKIIVVEGPVAAGKSKFAKQLATELGMLYLPEANLDMNYINEYGFDLRSLDPQLPENCKSFDVNNFLRNPRHRNAANFQIGQHCVKYSQYIDALAHVLSTGQGVILDRCVYSDFVFAEAMYSQGYLSKLARSKYYEFRSNTIDELLRPHLVIYLDVPIPRIQENIQKRNISYEKNSPVLTPAYLGEMEKQYKQNYLKEISKHAELLVYDWSEEGDVEIVVEDIERIDFSKYDSQETQMKDWGFQMEEDWAVARHTYSDKKDRLMAYCNIPCYEVDEMMMSPDEAETYHNVRNAAPGAVFLKGYNASEGDTGILFKVGESNRSTLPLRERRAPPV